MRLKLGLCILPVLCTLPAERTVTLMKLSIDTFLDQKSKNL
jgi:hypothetical protein